VLGATLLVAALLDGAGVAARLAGIGAVATVVGLGLRRPAELAWRSRFMLLGRLGLFLLLLMFAGPFRRARAGRRMRAPVRRRR
jgi:Trk-type K+ transport system membrane component